MGPRLLRGTAHDATKNPKTARLPLVLTLHNKAAHMLVWLSRAQTTANDAPPAWKTFD